MKIYIVCYKPTAENLRAFTTLAMAELWITLHLAGHEERNGGDYRIDELEVS